MIFKIMEKRCLFFFVTLLYFLTSFLSPVWAEESQLGGPDIYKPKNVEEIYKQIKKEKETSSTEVAIETTEAIETTDAEEAKPKPLFEEISNPHMGISCETCHKVKPTPISEEQEIHTLSNTFEFDEIKLCESCHKNNLHPVGINPSALETPVTIPSVFPLGKYGNIKDKITCSTCHKLHSMVGNFNLLRGFPESAFDFEPRFKDRQTFCENCHAEKAISRTPHKGENSPCGFCHMSDPKLSSEPQKTLHQEPTKICHFCHDKIDSTHYTDANPYTQEVPCNTCHDTHGYSKRGYFVMPEYEELANNSKKTNPHLRKAFCLTCHTEEPLKGNPKLRFEGEIIAICLWCHADDYPWRTADFHSIEVSADDPGKHRPKNLPLFDGKITCNTCHMIDCQITDKKETRKTNKNFLVGGPYKQRSDICYECHERDSYKKYNVHDQTDSRGAIREGVCVYCHRTQPDRKVQGRTQNLKNLWTTMTNLCVRCHVDTAHPGEKPHMKPPSSEMVKRKSVYEIEQNVSLPLDEKGEITCATCHNPHKKGIIPWGPGTKGADEPQKLRLTRKGGLLCQSCHSALGLK